MSGCDAIMIARAEYQEMVRSLPPVPEFDEPIKPPESNWLSRHIVQLFSALGSRLTSLGTWLKGTEEDTLDSTVGCQENIDLSSPDLEQGAKV